MGVIKEDEMGACRTHGRNENCLHFAGIPEGKKPLGRPLENIKLGLKIDE
jgi:hypothetical protein